MTKTHKKCIHKEVKSRSNSVWFGSFDFSFLKIKITTYQSIILLINSICCYTLVQSLFTRVKRLRASVKTELKRIFGLECEKVTTLETTAEWRAFLTKYSQGAKRKQGMNRVCSMHRDTHMQNWSVTLARSLVYINKQKTFGVKIDGSKYGIFGTTVSELN
jgi:hypothetical protein